MVANVPQLVQPPPLEPERPLVPPAAAGATDDATTCDGTVPPMVAYVPDAGAGAAYIAGGGGRASCHRH